MNKLFYQNYYYGTIQKICWGCLRKEFERMNVDLSGYEAELERIQEYAEEYEKRKAAEAAKA